MITRNERGKLSFNHLEMDLFFTELFEHCESREETEWLHDKLESYFEGAYEEKLNEFEDEE